MNCALIFEPRPRIGLFRCLRLGFGHCYLFLRAEQGWEKIDPFNIDQPICRTPALDGRLLAAGMAASGAAVVLYQDRIPASPPSLRLRPFTCVELCKQLLGRKAALVLTPWDLFQSALRS